LRYALIWLFLISSFEIEMKLQSLVSSKNFLRKFLIKVVLPIPGIPIGSKTAIYFLFLTDVSIGLGDYF